ncbi:MAG: ribonuclease HII [Candidatus Gastranaerophilaceae bacterium]
MTKSNNLFEFERNFSACSTLEGEPTLCKNFEGERKTIVIGTDEAGRGPGAGGVFASAVYFPDPNKELIKKLAFLNDSKKLSKKKREELYEIIIENAIHSTVCVEVEEIEKINILNASLKAMKLAVENVINEMQSCIDAKTQSDATLVEKRNLEMCHCEERGTSDAAIQKKSSHLSPLTSHILVLVDGNKLIKNFPSPLGGEGRVRVNITQKFIIKGDSKSASIAAASILAKVSRDRYMKELGKKFPQYNWGQNAGYLTAEHLDAIDKYGLTPIHRKSFLRKHNAKQLSLLN